MPELLIVVAALLVAIPLVVLRRRRRRQERERQIVYARWDAFQVALRQRDRRRPR